MNVPIENTKQNNAIGILVSVVVHALILLICWFYIVNEKPNPPLPKNGALRLGFDNSGLGDSYEEQAPSSPENIENTSQDVPNEHQIEEQAITTTQTDAPIINTEEVKPKNKPNKPSKPNPKPNPNASYTSSGSGTGKESGGNTSGTGVQGDPKGTYTNNPGEGGIGLDMAGWNWDKIPLPDKKSSEEGRVVIKVVIDDKGEVTHADILESTVNASFAQHIKMKVYQTTFEKIDGSNPPMRTEGKITYIIKAR